jgi:hypothetical protein
MPDFAGEIIVLIAAEEKLNGEQVNLCEPSD